MATFLEGSAWAEFEGFSNNLFLSAIECMDMGDEAYESWPTDESAVALAVGRARLVSRLDYSRRDVLASACRL